LKKKRLKILLIFKKKKKKKQSFSILQRLKKKEAKLLLKRKKREQKQMKQEEKRLRRLGKHDHNMMINLEDSDGSSRRRLSFKRKKVTITNDHFMENAAINKIPNRFNSIPGRKLSISRWEPLSLDQEQQNLQMISNYIMNTCRADECWILFPAGQECTIFTSVSGIGWVRDQTVGGVGRYLATTKERCSDRARGWTIDCGFKVESFWGSAAPGVATLPGRRCLLDYERLLTSNIEDLLLELEVRGGGVALSERRALIEDENIESCYLCNFDRN